MWILGLKGLRDNTQPHLINHLHYTAFPHDVTSAILVYQNSKAAAMLMFQTRTLFLVEHFSLVPLNLHNC